MHIIGPELDDCQHFDDRKSGKRLAGIGLMVQQEEGELIYVSKILPSGAAASCGMICIDDELLSVDNHTIEPDDDLAKV